LLSCGGEEETTAAVSSICFVFLGLSDPSESLLCTIAEARSLSMWSSSSGSVGETATILGGELVIGSFVGGSCSAATTTAAFSLLVAAGSGNVILCCSNMVYGMEYIQYGLLKTKNVGVAGKTEISVSTVQIRR